MESKDFFDLRQGGFAVLYPACVCSIIFAAGPDGFHGSTPYHGIELFARTIPRVWSISITLFWALSEQNSDCELSSVLVQLMQQAAAILQSWHSLSSLTTYLGRKDWAKSVPPISDRFMANIDTSLMQQIFNITQRKRKTNIHHNC